MSTPTSATEWTITNVQVEETPQGAEVHLVKEAPDGQRDFHSFPLETLEWRAAEYDIDPADTDALIDIIVHEPFLPDAGDPANVYGDAAAAAGFVSPAVEARRGVAPLELMPTTLMSAETPELARGAHQARIANAKATRAHVKRPRGKGRKDPCKPLVDAWKTFVDAGELEAKRSAVSRKRAQLAGAAAERVARGGTGARRRARREPTPMLEVTDA
ncbi:hypothetical protein K378_01452 [Streptomyces sp. Amel2xB2]|uniref:hypothetical protein n=1 Tax=Streptomyces sp. Amel2xB2 TaxID=1305829 RepID=UPI000DB9A74C|nr:hypothetical protein [Streptomyces sp. Amel2xB2]RAJ70287.1 hypothetical protein K378_01452 [Streptomyces sp. Amel2xB2]